MGDGLLTPLRTTDQVSLLKTFVAMVEGSDRILYGTVRTGAEYPSTKLRRWRGNGPVPDKRPVRVSIDLIILTLEYFGFPTGGHPINVCLIGVVAGGR